MFALKEDYWGLITAIVVTQPALEPLALLTAMRQDLRLSCITLIVVVLIPSTGPPFERPVDRVLAILVGTMGAVVAAAAIRQPRQGT